MLDTELVYLGCQIITAAGLRRRGFSCLLLSCACAFAFDGAANQAGLWKCGEDMTMLRIPLRIRRSAHLSLRTIGKANGALVEGRLIIFALGHATRRPALQVGSARIAIDTYGGGMRGRSAGTTVLLLRSLLVLLHDGATYAIDGTGQQVGARGCALSARS